MSINKDQIIDCLRQVNDPELCNDLISLNMVKNIAVCDGHVTIVIELTEPSAPFKDQLQSDIEKQVRTLPGDLQQLNIEFVAKPIHKAQATMQDKARSDNPLPKVKHVIAVGAGKGGVGKSTVALNLAVGLARKGLSVGLLDGDIYGPSLPTLLGLDQYQQTGTEKTLHPIEVAGIKAITIGKLVDPEKPLIWRGPMAHGAFSQLAQQTDWGELDYLIVDLPPGTGDVPLSLAQMLPLSGAVIVCTPQRVAQDDARRAIGMFEQLDIVVLGVVENMSYFIGDDGKEYDIFGRGGAEQMANELALPMLGTIPINMALRENCDNGQPLKNFEADSQLAAELEQMADNVDSLIAKRDQAGASDAPTLNIS